MPMTEEATLTGERPRILIQPRAASFSFLLGELRQYRHLFPFFAGNFIKARYRKTSLGWLWLVIQPLVPALVSAAVFSSLLKVPSDGVPYILFFLAGMSVWSLFANSLAMVTRSLGSGSRFITKLYFPRVIVPITSLAPAVVQFLVNFMVLVGACIFFSVSDGKAYIGTGPRLFLFPLFVFLAAFFALGIGLWTSVLNSQTRDVRFGLPYALQVWSFATPIIYPLSLVPEKWRFAAMINPMTPVIEGFKWSFLGRGHMDAASLSAGVLVILLVFVSGAWFFHRSQAKFIDNL